MKAHFILLEWILLVHRSQNNWTNAQNVFLRVLFKKRRRSGLRRGFLNGAIGKMGKYSVQLFKIRCTSYKVVCELECCVYEYLNLVLGNGWKINRRDYHYVNSRC